MVTSEGRIIIINGHAWKDVTNETSTGPVYNLEDVVACGGKTPWIISTSGTPKPRNKKRVMSSFIENKMKRKSKYPR